MWTSFHTCKYDINNKTYLIPMFPQGIIDHVPKHREGRFPAQQDPYQPQNWRQQHTQGCEHKSHKTATSDSKLAWRLVCHRNKHAFSPFQCEEKCIYAIINHMRLVCFRFVKTNSALPNLATDTEFI